MSEPLWIMVAGPYRAPDEDGRARNLAALNLAALQLLRAGHVPVIGVNLALPLIAAGAVTMAQSIRERALVNAALITGFALLFFTGGRATAVGLAAACLLAGLVTWRVGFGLIRHLLVTALIGALLYFVLLRGLPAALGLPGLHEGLLDRASDMRSAERRSCSCT